MTTQRTSRVLNRNGSAGYAPRFGSPFPGNAVYIGRGSKWGNPYKIGQVYLINGLNTTPLTREDAIKLYIYWFPTHLLVALPELAGKDLICYCAPLACHGDWLLELANKWRSQ